MLEKYSGRITSYNVCYTKLLRNKEITIDEPGTYYVHAFAQNEFGLSAYKTFGPFIVAEIDVPVVESMDLPVTGDVVVNADVVADGAVKVRLPGGSWQDSLTLDNIEPGTYISYNFV